MSESALSGVQFMSRIRLQDQLVPLRGSLQGSLVSGDRQVWIYHFNSPVIGLESVGRKAR